MPVTIIPDGNIFTSNCYVLVNPVNCVGVMGAGLALQFKLKYPDTYQYYVGLCKAGKLRLGRPRGYIENGKGIILLSTKYRWRETSRIEYVRGGLETLKAHWRVAFPALGCGLGGLPWQGEGGTGCFSPFLRL